MRRVALPLRRDFVKKWQCILCGFIYDEALGLPARGFTSRVVVALGYRSAADFNAAAPKSRLPEATLFTDI